MWSEKSSLYKDGVMLFISISLVHLGLKVHVLSFFFKALIRNSLILKYYFVFIGL